MHALEIKDKSIYLDGVKVKGVTGYELKGSAESPTAELKLTIIVEASQILLDNGSDYTDSNLV